ncbi:unnamed protein product [Musa acuminata var. zebrina]
MKDLKIRSHKFQIMVLFFNLVIDMLRVLCWWKYGSYKETLKQAVTSTKPKEEALSGFRRDPPRGSFCSWLSFDTLWLLVSYRTVCWPRNRNTCITCTSGRSCRLAHCIRFNGCKKRL